MEEMKGRNMKSRFHRLRWCCFLLLLFFMAGCGITQTLKKPEDKKEFAQETSRLEKLAREHSEPSVRAQSHLQLAFLYVNCRNPRLNYTRALQEMESYLSMAPAKAQTDDFKNWFAILQEVEKSRSSLVRVHEANRSLRDEMAGLKTTNNEMRETIERLKSLDLQMEEKRSLIK
jgi:isochorismate synthase EntC